MFHEIASVKMLYEHYTKMKTQQQHKESLFRVSPSQCRVSKQLAVFVN
jgi:hypothetical protein